MRKSCSGFTVVELLIILSLIALLFTLGMTQYNRFNRSQTLTKAKGELVSNLRLLQGKAMAAEKPAECGENELDGHRLEFINNHSYKMVAVCDCTDDCPEVKASVNFPSNVIKQLGPDGIFFKVLNRGVEFIGPQPPLVLSLIGSSETQALNLTTSGEIK